ncbi:hypothetical protein HMPREF9514_01197 [Enterococcus faecalis TX0855]|nr:hypothetical protein HMPREF9514_01197 [Enterococcus faecalis TX0855]
MFLVLFLSLLSLPKSNFQPTFLFLIISRTCFLFFYKKCRHY